MVATIALLSLSRYALWPQRERIIRGPVSTAFPRISKAERDMIIYKHDHFPGGRDVETPYGNIHVYEFGPEDGRKVLFVHGISTSCMTLEDIVRPLVRRGCRVLLFDLFGRGYSDAPGDVEYDTRLYTTQILLVLASSSLPWTGDNAFSMIGYSLGGGIAANFAAAFPHMVETLILLAPAGLIRPENFGRASRLIFTTGIIPERLLAYLTKRRLRAPIANAVQKRKGQAAAATTRPTTSANGTTGVLPRLDSTGKETFEDAAVQEIVDPLDRPDAEPTDFERRVGDFVHWTLDHHEGFVPAFMSTVRYAPMLGQHDEWRRLARRDKGTTAVLLGNHDTLVNKEDYAEDALPLLGGEENVFWRVVPGGHNFPFTHPKQALEQIYEFWGWEQDSE
ncbi:Alpha/Beta hydrolase protein [Microdochium bolleyi]|uniref:Alpha/Beta hydrolase protein n=1 Tax=Microdochium bolleyi TaxID=196109 RepID=A0A136JDT9_9PEZI|nr:Alpha/Beta hydrolase protein [Microdochium bolleyi]